MQHVTAFSRPETVPPVHALVPKRNIWILDSWRDLILYVGTPLLIVPLFWQPRPDGALRKSMFSSPLLVRWDITCPE